jgi:hypothetical protein
MKRMSNVTLALAIIIIILIGYKIYKKATFSPVILKAGWFQDFNGQSFELRKNGTYKFCELSIGEDCREGKFELHDSIITLDTALGSSRKLLISKVKDANGSRHLYQLDNSNSIITSAKTFNLLEDKSRK